MGNLRLAESVKSSVSTRRGYVPSGEFSRPDRTQAVRSPIIIIKKISDPATVMAIEPSVQKRKKKTDCVIIGRKRYTRKRRLVS